MALTEQQKQEIKEVGRPQNQKDEGPRKRRTVKPKTNPGVAELIVWSEQAWNKISEDITKAYLQMNKKKNLRQLTKAQSKTLEALKLSIFSNLDPFADVTTEYVYNSLKDGNNTPKTFADKLSSSSVKLEDMNIDEYRRYIIGTYIEVQIS